MAVIKYKNPKYTESGSEPKYIVIPTLTMENDEVYVGTTEPTEGEKIWVNPSNGLAKYKNGESWENLVPEVDLSNYLAKDNSTEYIPSREYNPATKKYVDDSKFSGNYDDLINKPTIPPTYVLSASTTSALGGIKVGYITSDKNYKVQLDENNNAYVNVPWVNTTYNKATSDVLGLVRVGYVTSNKNYAISLDDNGKMYVNVPWTDTDTHFTTKLYAGSGAATNAATTNGNTKLTVVDDNTIRSSITVKGTGATTVTSDASGVIAINSDNTTYSVVGANGTTGLIKNGSTVTSASGYTACPIISGVPYYKDTTYPVVTSSNNGLMDSGDKIILDKLTGVNTVTTLASLPITKRSIVATVTAATSLSLASNLELGQELYIRIYNNSSSAITQPIPNSGNFVSMNGTSVSIPSKSFIEMSIWCYESGKYSIRIGEIA